MRYAIVVLVLLLIVSLSYADTLQISCGAGQESGTYRSEYGVVLEESDGFNEPELELLSHGRPLEVESVMQFATRYGLDSVQFIGYEAGKMVVYQIRNLGGKNCLNLEKALMKREPTTLTLVQGEQEIDELNCTCELQYN
ncbi:MAG: hypothetical protein IT289_08235 [Oligoflexia bacterium]|nr:hypothetical protein [Oligoflexia bacterium]